MIDVYFLNPAVVAQIFNPNAELIKPREIPVNETNEEIETQPPTAEMKRRKCSK